MKIFKSKKNDLYLSDRPPLTPLGKLGLGITYAILITWACIVLWPIAQIIISSFNGKQGKYLILNDGFEFSLKHFDYLFNNNHFMFFQYSAVTNNGSSINFCKYSSIGQP